MSRISGCFDALRAAGRTGLVPYIVAGDPGRELTVPLMHKLVEGGADILELGVPFSDPMAEGPVIQSAHERALSNGIGLRDVLEMVREFRTINSETPVLLMGYSNPIEAMGYEKFSQAAVEAGVDAVLTVDMPPEEVEEFGNILKAAEIDNVLLIAPTTSPERVSRIVEHARGFIYVVSLKGVTGAGHLDVDSLVDSLNLVRAESSLPVAVGFGIKDVASATAVGLVADAVVVGSALVERFAATDAKLSTAERIDIACGLIRDMRAGLDGQ